MTTRIAYQPNSSAQISHELRIPLTGIMGMTHYLNQTVLTAEQQAYVDIIEAAANQLLSLEPKLH